MSATARFAPVKADEHAALLLDVLNESRARYRHQSGHESVAAERGARAEVPQRVLERCFARPGRAVASPEQQERYLRPLASGEVRAAFDFTIVTARASSYVGLRLSVVIVTISPGSAPSTKIAFPSTRAMPRPSWSSEAIVTAPGGAGRRDPVGLAGIEGAVRDRDDVRL
jgi:hypothetical protein